jgi:hypothetical protein
MASLADLTRYDAGRTIQFAEAGQKQRTLADLGQYAAKGDYAGAASAAFAGGQPDVGASFAKMDADKQQRVVQDAASYAQAATTPEQWAQAGAEFKKTHPEFEWPADFRSRDLVISRALSAQDQINNQLKARAIAVDEQKAATASNPFGGTQIGDNLPAVQVGDSGVPDADQQKAFLSQLDPGTAKLVQDIANYKMDISKVTSLRGSERRIIAQLVSQYDPTFDMTQYTSRSNMRKQATSGTIGQNIQALNLSLQHLGGLEGEVQKLGNGSFTPLNFVKNKARELAGDPNVTNFRQNAMAVATEVAKVFRGAGAMSEREIQDWMGNFSENASPEQMQGAIDKARELLAARLDTINSQYRAAMGKPMDFSVLTPHTIETLTPEAKRILGIGDASASATADTGQGPQPGAVEDGFRFKGGNPADPSSWEQVQ